MPNFVDPIYVTDKEGNKHLVSGIDGIPVGSAALLQAGTDTVPRLWTAKQISDEIKRLIAGG